MSTNICKSDGCDRETRLRPFKGSLKLYPEKRCGVCMATLRRYGITGPERDYRKANKIPLRDPKERPHV